MLTLHRDDNDIVVDLLEVERLGANQIAFAIMVATRELKRMNESNQRYTDEKNGILVMMKDAFVEISQVMAHSD